MRIYSRDEFMKLPPGVLFAKGERWSFDGLCVKGETTPPKDGYSGDWFYTSLVDIDAGSTHELMAAYDKMEGGASHPMNTWEQRDGCFATDDLFLVWERSDLDALRVIIEAAKAALLEL